MSFKTLLVNANIVNIITLNLRSSSITIDNSRFTFHNFPFLILFKLEHILTLPLDIYLGGIWLRVNNITGVKLYYL